MSRPVSAIRADLQRQGERASMTLRKEAVGALADRDYDAHRGASVIDVRVLVLALVVAELVGSASEVRRVLRRS